MESFLGFKDRLLHHSMTLALCPFTIIMSRSAYTPAILLGVQSLKVLTD